MQEVILHLTLDHITQLQSGQDIIINGYNIYGEFLNPDDIESLQNGNPMSIQASNPDMSCEHCWATLKLADKA